MSTDRSSLQIEMDAALEAVADLLGGDGLCLPGKTAEMAVAKARLQAAELAIRERSPMTWAQAAAATARTV